MPLITSLVSAEHYVVPLIAASSLAFLAMLGALSARAGGAHIGKAAARVAFWGALAMAMTATVGAPFGITV
jgi:VIT1/CCC1 family predicted Fe2+/Mn2+ transporter